MEKLVVFSHPSKGLVKASDGAVMLVLGRRGHGSSRRTWDLADRANRALEAGADIIMIESEGITENVGEWNTAAAASIINSVGLENVMFEAADPLVFEWYVKNYGNEVNLFVDHSQILQLEGLR